MKEYRKIVRICLNIRFEKKLYSNPEKHSRLCMGMDACSDYPNGSLFAKLNMDNTFKGSFMASPNFKFSIFIVSLILCSHSSLLRSHPR